MRTRFENDNRRAGVGRTRTPGLNLLHLYEYYLLGTFLLGALQIRNYVAMLRFAIKVPNRWPELYQILRANFDVLLTWPLLLVGTITAGLWALHVILRRAVWPQADVRWQDLAAEPWWLALVCAAGAVMVVLDGWAWLRAARFRAPRLQWLLTATDLALRTSAIGTPLRLLVGWHLRTRLVRRMPILIRWTLRRAAELGARLATGLALWGGWALQRAS